MSKALRQAALLLLPLWALAALPAGADGMPAAPGAGAGAAAGARCAAPDRVLFACKATGGHHILLCGQLPGRVQVQLHGAANAPLLFPANPGTGPQVLGYAQYGRYQLDRVEIAFEQAGTRYALFDHTEAGRRQFGLDIVAPGARTETRLACQSSRRGSLRQLRQHIRCDRDSELNQLDCK